MEKLIETISMRTYDHIVTQYIILLDMKNVKMVQDKREIISIMFYKSPGAYLFILGSLSFPMKGSGQTIFLTPIPTENWAFPLPNLLTLMVITLVS